jgi:hypothetical protein
MNERRKRMGEYQRVTRECTLDSMRPELTSAIKEHIERYELEGVTENVLFCCETISTKEKKGLLGRKTETEVVGVILTPKWLIWAGGKENEKAGVLSSRLHDLRVQDYEKTSLYQMIEDTGVNVDGFRTGQAGSGSVFIGLGKEPAAEKFRKMLKEAVAQV